MVDSWADLENNVPYDCFVCTACCRFLDVRVLPDDEVPEGMTRFAELGLVLMRRKRDGSCIALDGETGECRIYDRRPAACREFRVGGSGCLDVRAWEEKRRAMPDGGTGCPTP